MQHTLRIQITFGVHSVRTQRAISVQSVSSPLLNQGALDVQAKELSEAHACLLETKALGLPLPEKQCETLLEMYANLARGATAAREALDVLKALASVSPEGVSAKSCCHAIAVAAMSAIESVNWKRTRPCRSRVAPRPPLRPPARTCAGRKRER